MKKNPIILAIMALFLLITSCTRENVRGDRVIRNAVTDKDGNHYDAVKIGNQVWMQSNLRTKHFRDGSAIPRGSYDGSYTEPYYYQPTTLQFPTHDETTYGFYYNWAAVDDTRGLCPKGWHVPTEEEWIELEEYVGSKSEYVYGGDSRNIAKALASNVGWCENDEPGTPGYEPENNNTTGFAAVPADELILVPEWWGPSFGEYAWFWTSSDKYMFDNRFNVCMRIEYDRPDAGLMDGTSKSHGLSVRCVRD